MASCNTQQETKNCITLKGSTDIIVEFFQYSINSILYQRGIYPPEKFTPTKHYNLQMMITTDKDLQEYLNHVLLQLQNWLINGSVEKLVLVIASQEDKSILERWQFNIETDQSIIDANKDEIKQYNDNLENKNPNIKNKLEFESKQNENENKNKFDKNGKPKTKEKSKKEITREIQAIIRQITSSVTFLPLLEVACSFDLLVFTKNGIQVPKKWEKSDAKIITNSEEVKLRSFTTSIHQVDSLVSYKVDDDDSDDDDWDI